MKCKTVGWLQLIMHKLTTAQTLNILTLLDSGFSGVQISHKTGLSTAAITIFTLSIVQTFPSPLVAIYPGLLLLISLMLLVLFIWGRLKML